ncbi:uncharacterized protein CEXT_718071 [Caerostris extrusa]|uniref:A-kinase anchor protein 2 C-terminal domain-containing protein n=1 Tax=Caerostris extrusa TaxID=172846 RepID=A0AAV4XQS0_CAEEX|nr:uncharacterized protein CEXT_718071 [Caerostris extrusa]
MCDELKLAVVDTSSILEHREEIRDLWERRMMADDNQTSPSSAVAEKPSSNPKPEEGSEGAVAKTSGESETKLSNGFAHHEEAKTADEEEQVKVKQVESEEVKKINEEDTNKTRQEDEAQSSVQTADADHDNNNNMDSLEVTNQDDYVEEKTYTSETCLVMKQVEEQQHESSATPAEVEETVAKVEEQVTEESKKETTTEEPAPDTTTQSVEEVDAAVSASVSSEVEKPIQAATQEEPVSSTFEKVESETEGVCQTSESAEVHEVVTSTTTTTITTMEQVHHSEEESASKVQTDSLAEVEKSASDDDDGFVRVEECLPKVESSEVEQESFVVVEKPEVAETSKEASEATAALEDQDLSGSAPTPEPGAEEKASNPEIEQFVKSGGVKRIIPGVQKTEQPYSTCTTETKIAMEIREMREREEELRIMREQNLLSPAPSPVPPKSPLPRSPSPTVPKEGSSPTTPPPGCGYRVSSVFGHKGGATSPVVSPDEEKKASFKGFNKESSVEKEIRIARDREEELRKQKGLPPREDDSYVKPSQVKSSQVRVFGKVAGGASVKQAATAKIQLEIEEQTQREMALRESGSIRTISQERTDAKVAKLKAAEEAPATNGTAHPVSNGNHTNGRSSPDKRGSPSPTGGRPATIFSQTNGKSGISMHKFIASKGKETTFAAPRNGVAPAKEEGGAKTAVVPPAMVKIKRNVSVESKIQQEILELKQREEELKKLHSNRSSVISNTEDGDNENEMNQKNNLNEYENGIHEEELSPRHNKLIAQWEQRIQKAES